MGTTQHSRLWEKSITKLCQENENSDNTSVVWRVVWCGVCEWVKPRHSPRLDCLVVTYVCVYVFVTTLLCSEVERFFPRLCFCGAALGFQILFCCLPVFFLFVIFWPLLKTRIM